MSAFEEWYERQGYLAYDEGDRGSGANQCAKNLGVSPHHIRMMLRGDRNPSGPIERLMQIADEKDKNNS